MIMNEREKTTQRPADGTAGFSPGLTAEETARLLALLTAAYPSPKKDVRAAVMNRIRAERAQPSRVLPAADPRGTGRSARPVWGRIAKWGALAACLLLVTAVGVRFLPAVTRDLAVADKAVQNAATNGAPDGYDADEAAAYEACEAAPAEAAYDAMPDEALEEAAPEPEEGGMTLKSSPPKRADVPAAEAPMAEEPEAPAPEPNGLEAFTAEAEEEYAAEAENAAGSALYEADYGGEPEMPGAALGTSMLQESAVTGGFGFGNVPIMISPADDAMPNGERSTGAAAPRYTVQTDCGHAGAYRNAYHNIPAVLIERVGAEAFEAWAAEAQAQDPCGVNILSFALRFGMTKEDIYAAGDVWYYCDLPEDLALTEENAAAIEAYYAAGGDPEKMAAREAVYALKTAIIKEAGLDAYLAWRGETGGSNALRAWTAREGAAALGIGDARLAELAAACGCTERQLDE